jgi:hypothetical protein
MQKTINPMTQVRGIGYLPRSLVTGDYTPHSYPTYPRRNQTTYSPNLVEEVFAEFRIAVVPHEAPAESMYHGGVQYPEGDHRGR